VRVRNLSAGPVPAAVLDQVRSQIESTVLSVTGSVNLTVRQVALRNGCFAVLGATR